VRAVQLPITDPAGSVDEVLTRLREIVLRGGPPAGMKVGGDE
jgi:hypothetical protein